MMKLYYLPGSAAMAPHAVLEEAGADYELVRVTREDGKVDPPLGAVREDEPRAVEDELG